MSTLEKAYSLFAILFAVTLVAVLFIYPEMRQPLVLLPASGLGLLINVLFMFVVFRDIFSRQFPGKFGRIFWTALILFFWPAILIYLPLYGFRSRNISS